MYRRIIRRDIARNKLITLTMTLFVAAAALLVALAALLIVHLSGSIDTLMTQARTPHMTQMHAGDLDAARLAAFAEQSEHVEQYQAVEFVNIDGARIRIGEQTLAGSVQDNGFVKQNESFDYLLDLDGQVIQPRDGEVYIPIGYWRDGTAKLGDTVTVEDKTFTVSGFLRDSQMNSPLASSKRLLVSDQAFAELRPLGSIEYLIEFRLRDLSTLTAFQTEYTDAGLEANGPALTYPLFRMLNAISDGMMIGVLLLVSLLVVVIALLCIRFTLLAKLEDDYREIGAMKAIGMRLADIKRLYLAKYAAIAAAGSVLGFAAACALRGALLDNIRLYMGESGNDALALAIGALGALLVLLAILGYVSGVLRHIRRIPAAEALRYGVSQSDKVGARRLRLSRNRLLPVNLFLGVQDVLSRKRLYATMLTVLILASFIMIVPHNLHHTISQRSFSGYMGIGAYDLRLDLQQSPDIAERATAIADKMAADPDISRYTVLMTKSFQVRTAEGTTQTMRIELGDQDAFPVQYSKGGSPQTADKIALSALQAEELKVTVGDPLVLASDSGDVRLEVSGIYSDITHGGKTAKASFADDSGDIVWAVVYAELTASSDAAAKAAAYSDSFPYAKVSDIEAFIDQTFGSTIRAVGQASQGAIAVALLIALLVTLLFIKLLLAKDRYAIAVMQAFGFTNRDIKLQYITRSLFVLLLGLSVGTLLANTLGERLAGAVIASFGASSFEFAIDPLSAYVIYPVLMGCAVGLATLIGTSGSGNIILSEHIKE